MIVEQIQGVYWCDSDTIVLTACEGKVPPELFRRGHWSHGTQTPYEPFVIPDWREEKRKKNKEFKKEYMKKSRQKETEMVKNNWRNPK